MKRIVITVIIGIYSLTAIHTLFAQETARERIARRQAQQASSGSPLSVRAQIKNAGQTQELENAPWMREIYRFLDLEKEKNAALYYPVTPIGNRMNLFSIIFNQLADKNIYAYRYQLDGNVSFDEQHKETFKDILDQFEILHTEENGKYHIETVDIPSNEVLGYYLKEVSYFDKNNSVIATKPLAICPVMYRQEDYGDGTISYPMFWILYEDIRPYLSQAPIMTSSLNNASTQTINDFFIKHSFDGEIYKTTNLRNLSLVEQFPDEAERKLEQAKIEKQLKDVSNGLWVYNDSIGAANRSAAKTNNKKASTGSTSGNNTSGSTDRAAVQKEQKANATPTRSMRDRRRN